MLLKIQDSHILKEVIEVFPSEVGKLFFLKRVVIIEINEGVHLNHKNAEQIFLKIKDFFGNKKRIGIISNRINNYSIQVLDYQKFFNYIPNIKLYGIVHYNKQHFYSYQIEKRFSPIPLQNYNTIDEALDYTLAMLNKNAFKRLA